MGYPGKGCMLAVDQLWKQFMRPDSGHKVYAVTPRVVRDDGSKSDIPEYVVSTLTALAGDPVAKRLGQG